MQARHASPLARAALVLALAATGFATAEAEAHRRFNPEEIKGIPIASLSHGQMAVIADYRSDIMKLAAQERQVDDTFVRLLNYGNIQYTYCLWGLVPGTLADEESPFNECAHAYLSAARELLSHMRETSANKEAVEDLVSRIDADMVRKESSFVLCQYSADTFDTASVVRPVWSDIPKHLPSLAAFSGLGLAFAAAGMVLGKRRARPDKRD